MNEMLCGMVRSVLRTPEKRDALFWAPGVAYVPRRKVGESLRW